MMRTLMRILFLMIILLSSSNDIISAFMPDRRKATDQEQDTLYDRQILFNGRIWKSRYGQILGHEFFMTKNWLSGEVTINKKIFSNVKLKYDLFNDELLAMVNSGTVVILSNEKVESFTLKNEQEIYRFTNYNPANSSLFRGYGHLLYGGKASLIVKYNKQIKVLAVENKYDEFYQKQQVYILINGQFSRIRSRKDFFNLFADRREEIQKYVREKGLTILPAKPETLIPVLRFYDSLFQTR
jgi:hypothetical protein